MNWIYYLLEANFYLAVFYALYYFIFRHETWYQLSRAYLLAGSLLSFIIPFVQLGFLKAAPQYNGEIALEQASQNVNIHIVTPVLSNNWSANDYALAIYLLIVSALLVNLCIKIIKLINLSRKHKNSVVDTYKLVETTGEQDAFSFFNYLFINPQLASKQTIIHHELIHIRQKHSWDIIYLEIIKIFNWFNPLVYMIQYSVKELHEFIADNETVKLELGPSTYTDFLLNNAYGVNGHNLTNPFFNKNLLKKRIIMLNQKKSGKSARLKYLLAIPVIAGLLCLSTLAFAKDYGWINLLPAKNTTFSKASSSSAKFGYVIYPDSYNSKTINKIGAKLYKEGYKLEYSDFFDDDKQPLLKISITRLRVHAKGWDRDTAASATFLVNYLTKKGLVIFVGADDAHHELYVHSEKQSPKDPKTLTNPVLPLGIKKDSGSYSNHYTSNGFRYEETGYLIGDRTNFRVIITEKTGEQKSYFKNSATAAQLKELKEKYGYTFPTMAIFKRLPPPPPAPAPGPPAPAVDKRPPPPPPAPPHNKLSDAVIPRENKTGDDVVKTDTVYASVDKTPQFPGGFNKFLDYIHSNLKYPEVARKNKTEGRVIAGFIVNQDGSITDARIMRGLTPETDNEVLRLINAMPQWEPGITNGKAVRVSYNIPIAFKL